MARVAHIGLLVFVAITPCIAAEYWVDTSAESASDEQLGFEYQWDATKRCRTPKARLRAFRGSIARMKGSRE